MILSIFPFYLRAICARVCYFFSWFLRLRHFFVDHKCHFFSGSLLLVSFLFPMFSSMILVCMCYRHHFFVLLFVSVGICCIFVMGFRVHFFLTICLFSHILLHLFDLTLLSWFCLYLLIFYFLTFCFWCLLILCYFFLAFQRVFGLSSWTLALFCFVSCCSYSSGHIHIKFALLKRRQSIFSHVFVLFVFPLTFLLFLCCRHEQLWSREGRI